LERKGYFSPPDIKSLEEVLEYGISLKAGRVFADLWDLEQFSSCEKCLNKRKIRLQMTNNNQHIQPPILCSCD
jgi:hypothetical protein